MSNVNRPTIETRNTAVSNGIDKHIPASISIGSVMYTPPELKAVFTAHHTALDAADALRKQWPDQVQVARAAGEKADEVYLLLRSALIGQYGKQANATLNDFGMRPPKSTVATTKVKAEAVDKRAATRVARHTMGKVQRKAVTGASVPTPAPVATAAPVAAPAAPTAPATSITPGTTTH